MPIIFKNNFAGQTPGATVTGANSANSGDPFSHVLPTTGGTITYVSIDGRMVVRMTPTGTATPSTRQTISESQGRVMVTRRRFYWDGTTKTSARPLQVHHTSPFGSPSSTQIAFAQVRASQPQVEVLVGSGTVITASRVHLPAAGWYELEMVTISSSAAGANDGTVKMYLYASDGTTLVNKQADGTTVVPNVFTGQSLTDVHPGSVRWGTASVASVPTHDDLAEPQAMWTNDLAARLPKFDANTTLPAVENVTITQTIPPTTSGGSNGQIVLTWSAVTDADHDGYEIGVAAGLGATSGFTVVGNAARTATTYTVTGRSPGPYTVAVRSIPA